MKTDSIKTNGLVLLIIAGLIAAISVSRWIDAHRGPLNAGADDESLYLNGKTARRISLAFNGLAADWYWMRSLQYVGGKIVNMRENVVFDNLEQLNLKLLPSLL